MSELVVRRLMVDLQSPFAARWCGGDAFRSALFSALSMSFPLGEQYFIDSVRNGVKTMSPQAREKFAAEVQGFIGQEATHRHLHGLFNANLERLGFSNEIERRSARRIQAQAHLDPRMHVAATAATEHFTAIFAEWMLTHPEILSNTEPRLQALWMWHSAEESEHRCTAFDVYVAMGGNHKWRLRVFRYITVVFLTDVMRQTVRNLWHDGALFKWSTWRSGAAFLFGRHGMLSSNFGRWRAYMARDFHPSQQEDRRARDWLRDNGALFKTVGEAR